MWETTVEVQGAQEVMASPEQVWQFFSSPVIWSLRPDSFAFDPASPDGASRFRIVLGIDQSGAMWADVFEVRDELPGRSLTLSLASDPEAGELALCFSAVTGNDGTQVAITARHQVRRGDRSATRSAWRKRLEPWLAECAAVLEGRRPPLTGELPDRIRAACMRRRTAREMEESVQVSASVLVSAPPDRVWEILWDPATQLHNLNS